jgi:hypothetical protein
VFVVAELWDRWALLSYFDALDPKALDISKAQRDARCEAVEKRRPCAGDWLYGRQAYQTPYQYSIELGGAGAGGGIESDTVLVVHAWRRSTTADPERADGRYVMLACMAKMSDPVLLVDQPYAWPRLPVSWWSPWPAPSGGLCGTGFAHVLRGHQKSLDKSDYQLQRHMDELGHKKVLIDSSTAEAEAQVLAEMAERRISVVRVPGMQMPQVVEMPALHEGHLAWSREVRGRAREDSGVPAVIASGETNRGAGASAVAIVEESDRATDRVSNVYNRWTRMRINVAERTMECIEDGLTANRDFRASFHDSDGSWRGGTSWSELHRLNEDYSIGLETAGALGRTRYGRLLKALDLASKGMLNPKFAQDMLEQSPDVRAATRLQSAPRQRVYKKLGELIKPNGRHDWALGLDADVDLDLAVDVCVMLINEADNAGADFETIERLRKFKATAQGLREELAAQNAPAPALTPEAQIGAPAPAPALVA